MTKEVVMHNLISFNQLAVTKHDEDKIVNKDNTQIDEYFECLVECEGNSHDCKSVCKEVFL